MLDDTNNIASQIDVDAIARVAEDDVAAGESASGFGLSKKNARLWQTVTQELRNKLGRPVRPEDFVAYSKTKVGYTRIGHLFPARVVGVDDAYDDPHRGPMKFRVQMKNPDIRSMTDRELERS